MGSKPPQPKRKRLCSLISSVTRFSATNEDYHRVYRQLRSRNTFIVSIAVTQLKHLQCSLVTSLRNRIQSVSPVVRRRQRKYTLTPIPNRPSDVTAVGPWCIVVDRAHRASIASDRAQASSIVDRAHRAGWSVANDPASAVDRAHRASIASGRAPSEHRH